MSELKAKDCPLCGHKAKQSEDYAKCSRPTCYLNQYMSLSDWNTRPRERELEEKLAEVLKALDEIEREKPKQAWQSFEGWARTTAKFAREKATDRNSVLVKGVE